MKFSLVVSRKSLSYEKITVAATAIGFTAAKILGTSTTFDPSTGCKEIFATLEGAPIRFLMDGTTPTSAIGHLMQPGDNLTLQNPWDIQKFRAIRTTGTSGSLYVTYKF